MWDLLISSALAEGEATATPAPSWAQTAFEKFGEISTVTWIVWAVVALIGAGLLVIALRRPKWTPKMLSYAALSIALAFVLSCIRVWRMPQGGSITPASTLPLIIFAYAFGTAPGLVAGAVYGLLQLIQDNWMLNVWQVLLDYVIAFGMVGLAGLFHKMEPKPGLMAGVTLASLGRLLASVLSGVVFFASYAPEGTSPLWYSITYNGTYILPELVICLVVSYLAGPRIMSVLKTK